MGQPPVDGAGDDQGEGDASEGGDPFHVVKLFNEVIEELRREEQEGAVGAEADAPAMGEAAREPDEEAGGQARPIARAEPERAPAGDGVPDRALVHGRVLGTATHPHGGLP